MCLIIDTNMFNDFLDEDNQDMLPIRTWLHKRHGKIAYSPTAKMEAEFAGHREMKRKLLEYDRAGLVKYCDKEEVESVIREMTKLENMTSDDEHILGLVRAFNINLLVSRARKLHSDFTTIIRGSIYQTRQHRHLLTQDTCP